MTRLPDDCFALPPGFEWTPVETALSLLEERLHPVVGVETLPLDACSGRILAKDLFAARPHPATDNAAVDGYAFLHPGDAPSEPLRWRLLPGRAAAGAPFDGTVGAGEAVRILTGAPMPEGADTVVLQEDVERAADGALLFRPPQRPGANRRRAGENLALGARALTAGQRLGPAALAQAAAAGCAQLPVRAPLRVALFSTGDELIDLSKPRPMTPANVIDSNRPMIAAILSRAGFEPVDLGALPDDRAAIEGALDEAASRAHAIIASGGASGGDEDHVAAALAQRGAENGGYHLWRIAMKPGRPLALATRRGVPVFGLPGNPVAAFVCMLIFGLPALRRLAGGPFQRPQPLKAPSGFAYRKKPGRREYLRVRLGEDGRLEKYRSEGSGLIEGLLWSDGLADLPHEAGPVSPGDMLDYLPYSAFGIAP